MQKTLLPLDTLVTLRQIMVIQLQLGIVLKLTEKIVYPLVMKALIAN
ncbi:adhesin [Yersinia enterocolitica]|nr:adhesin [Yersinia enterocolitica]AOF25385.1 adhesin [Yersinia enterocolitica]